MKYDNFEIRLQRQSGPELYSVAASWDGRSATQPFLAPATAYVGFHRGDDRRVDVRQLVTASSAPVTTPIAAGDALYRALFSGSVGTLFTEALAKIASDAESGVRLQIVLDPADSVTMTLPWELLQTSPNRDFLALNRRTPVVRRLLTDATARRPLAPALLRILVLIASPHGLPPLNTDQERQAIETALRHEQVEVVVLEKTTVEGMLRSLRVSREPFHVLHFIGHGSYENEVGHLVFEDALGMPSRVSGSELARYLVDWPTIRLVFLNACETAATGSPLGGHAFSGVAAALLDRGFPVVVAMQQAVADEDAIAFSSTVYGQLAAGASVEASVSEGRKVLYAADPGGSAWAIPSVFSSLEDSRLFLSINRGWPRLLWSTLWTILGLSTLAVTLNFWSLTQGWDVHWFDPGKGRYAVAVYGTLMGGSLTVLLIELTNSYRRRIRDVGISERLPVAFALAPLDHFPSFKRPFQAFFLVLFLLVPTAAQIHFLVKMSAGTVTDTMTGEAWSGIAHFTRAISPSVLVAQDVRYLLDTERPVSFFPFYQPWAILGFVTWLVVRLVKAIRSLVSKRGLCDASIAGPCCPSFSPAWCRDRFWRRNPIGKSMGIGAQPIAARREPSTVRCVKVRTNSIRL